MAKEQERKVELLGVKPIPATSMSKAKSFSLSLHISSKSSAPPSTPPVSSMFQVKLSVVEQPRGEHCGCECQHIRNYT